VILGQEVCAREQVNPSLLHLNVVAARAEKAFVLVAAKLRPSQVGTAKKPGVGRSRCPPAQ
jgi:hypothetical protein